MKTAFEGTFVLWMAYVAVFVAIGILLITGGNRTPVPILHPTQLERIETKIDRLLKVAEQYEPGEKESQAKPVGGNKLPLREVSKCH